MCLFDIAVLKGLIFQSLCSTCFLLFFLVKRATRYLTLSKKISLIILTTKMYPNSIDMKLIRNCMVLISYTYLTGVKFLRFSLTFSFDRCHPSPASEKKGKAFPMSVRLPPLTFYCVRSFP